MNRAVRSASSTHIGGIRTVFLTLALGVMVQSIYLLSLEALNIWYIEVLAPPPAEQKIHGLSLSPRNYLLLAYSLIFFSRVVAGLLCLIMRPRLILLLFLAGSLAFTIAFVALPEGKSAKDPNLVAMLGIMIFLFLAPVFPLVYAITSRGMGEEYEDRGSNADGFEVYRDGGEERPELQRRQSGIPDIMRQSEEDEERGWERWGRWGSWGEEKIRRASAVGTEKVKKVVVVLREWDDW